MTELILGVVIKEGIPAAIKIIQLLRAKTDPTLEDWEKQLTEIQAKRYEDYVKAP